MRPFDLLLLILTLTVLPSCAGAGDTAANQAAQTAPATGYTQITQAEAKEMMAGDDGHIVVDVRRQDEFDDGHIPGAVCIPNEEIGGEMPAGLPDRDQIILVYCRSGRRSKEAAEKLAAIGYTHVYEFGGILDWTGEIVKTEAETNGGGGSEERPPAVAPTPMLVVRVNEHTFYASPADNPSAEAFVSELSRESIEVQLREYGGFEKVGDLPWSIPRNDTSVTTVPGDIMLYQGDQITIFYGSNSWSYSPLAKISAAQEELAEALGSGDVTVQLEIKWSE